MPINLSVPGRICLFGDKIDIAHKPVIAAAVDIFMHISASAMDDPDAAVYSRDLNVTERFTIGEQPETCGALKYVQAAAWLLRERLPAGFCMEVQSDIPIGAGLSTSAALTVGAIMALDELFGLGMRRDEIAETAYIAEHDVCGVSCGRMDQYAIAFGGVTFISTGEPASAEVLDIDELPVVVGDTSEPGRRMRFSPACAGDLRMMTPWYLTRSTSCINIRWMGGRRWWGETPPALAN
ncbi:MAG: hypothetical protein GX131_19620 [candidate division WS1 bacterium]|nr:hypothetical protein [candidate division WS1 bacterium]